jgi:hypothetical protein
MQMADVAVFWHGTGRVLTSGSFAVDESEDESPVAHVRLRKPIDPDTLRDALARARARADARRPVG